METHVLQSDLWAKFKNSYGTTAVDAGNVWYTKHPIPLSGHFYGYAPRVDPRVVDFAALRNSLEENNCIALHFDVPNIVKGTPEEAPALKILEEQCVKSPRDEFAKANFLMDLTKSEEELFAGLHYKQRYNVRYAQKKGVTVREDHSEESMEKFYELYRETGERQKYYHRPKIYLRKLWEIFNAVGKVHILLAELEGEVLAAWFLLTYGDVLYYPYGGSSEKNKNLQASCLIGWEAILYGKKLGLKTFDMWGAAVDLADTSDEYYGFSNFKAKYGGKHVSYIDSYDYVVNQSLYTIFTAANTIRWKLLKALK